MPLNYYGGKRSQTEIQDYRLRAGPPAIVIACASGRTVCNDQDAGSRVVDGRSVLGGRSWQGQGRHGAFRYLY